MTVTGWMIGCGSDSLTYVFVVTYVEDVSEFDFFLCTQEATKVAGHSIGVTAIIKLLGLTVMQMIGQLLFAVQ